jgi:hypothetical protein
MSENPASSWWEGIMADYHRQQLVNNDFASHATQLAVVPQSVAVGLPQVGYRPPPGESSMGRALAKSRKRVKARLKLRRGAYSVFNGRVFWD